MEKTYLSAVPSGAVIGKDVYGMDGVLLIPKGATFKDHYTQSFRNKGVTSLFVDKSGSLKKDTIEEIRASMEISDIIHDKTRTQAINQVKKTIVNFSCASGINISKLSKIVSDMIEQILEKKDFVFALSQLRSIDDYTYKHSVNVGVISLLIGTDLKLDSKALMDLGIGAILHDIGKVLISEDILKKPTKLTYEEFQEIKKHPQYGYDILKQSNVSEDAAQIALYHHEKVNGTGYTSGLKSSDIPLFSRIVAIADVYDAMSNDRIYQKKKTPDIVYSEITHASNTHFDSNIMETFCKHLSIYPNGTGIVLNTNHKGMVLSQNRMYPESPVVRIFKNDRSDLSKLYVDIDLSLSSNLFIKNAFI